MDKNYDNIFDKTRIKYPNTGHNLNYLKGYDGCIDVNGTPVVADLNILSVVLVAEDKNPETGEDDHTHIRKTDHTFGIAPDIP